MSPKIYIQKKSKFFIQFSMIVSSFRPEHRKFYQIKPANGQNYCLTMGFGIDSYGILFIDHLYEDHHTQNQSFFFHYDKFKQQSRICAIIKNKIGCIGVSKAENGYYPKIGQVNWEKSESWQIHRVEHGFYAKEDNAFTIRNHNGYYLDIENLKAESKKRVTVWSKTQNNSQIWKIVPLDQKVLEQLPQNDQLAQDDSHR